MWGTKCLFKESFCDEDISIRRQNEFDGLTLGAHGPIEIFPMSFHFNIGFVNLVRISRRLQKTGNSLLKFGTILMNPGHDYGMSNLNSSVFLKLDDVPQT